MSFTILWTDEAKETYDIIVTLIENKWGMLAASKFVAATHQKINQISLHPYLFKASISENVRQIVITKQTSLLYEIHGDRIIIMFFMDNRQEPII